MDLPAHQSPTCFGSFLLPLAHGDLTSLQRHQRCSRYHELVPGCFQALQNVQRQVLEARHFVVKPFLCTAGADLLSVPPQTNACRQSWAPGVGDSRCPKATSAARDARSSAGVDAQPHSPPALNKQGKSSGVTSRRNHGARAGTKPNLVDQPPRTTLPGSHLASVLNALRGASHSCLMKWPMNSAVSPPYGMQTVCPPARRRQGSSTAQCTCQRPSPLGEGHQRIRPGGSIDQRTQRPTQPKRRDHRIAAELTPNVPTVLSHTTLDAEEDLQPSLGVLASRDGGPERRRHRCKRGLPSSVNGSCHHLNNVSWAWNL